MNVSGYSISAFVVGMNGSGTTMLADSLGRHPELYVFPLEVRLLPYFIQRRKPQDTCESFAQRRQVADELCKAKPFWHANGREVLHLQDAELARPGLACTIDAVFMNFARRAGKSHWAEKSPMNVLHMLDLAATFPAARFIHIVRDGRDAAQSFHRRYGFCPEETVYRWKRIVQRGRQQGERLGPGRYMECRYEELTSDPRRGMESICQFLGLPFDEAVLESSMRMADEHMAAGSRTIVQNSGKWVDYFSPRKAVALERIAGQELQAAGYSVGVAGNENPGRLKRGAWRAVGFVRRTARHFGRWGWAGLPGFLRTLRVSARQAMSGRE